MAATESKGPITGNAQDWDISGGSAGDGFSLGYSADKPQGHFSWEVFDENGASVASGSANLANKASGATIDTVDTSSYPASGYTYRMTVSGKHDGTSIQASGNGCLTQISGSGNFEATGAVIGTV